MRTLPDGNEQEAWAGELPAYHLCQAVSRLHDQLKRDGIASAREILDGTVRIVSIRELAEDDIRLALREGIDA